MVMSPNLRPDDISKMQRLMLQDLAQHRRTIEIEMPGELDMTPRSQIVLAVRSPNSTNHMTSSRLTESSAQYRGTFNAFALGSLIWQRT